MIKEKSEAPVIFVAGILERIDCNLKKVLFQTRWKPKTSPMYSGMLEIPGGRVNDYENIFDALQREVREECGLKIKIIKLIGANSYFIKDIQRIEITFLCKAINPSEIKLSHEHADYKWLKITEVNAIKITDYIKKIIDSSAEDIAE